MIEKANIDEFEGRFEALRDALVGLAGLGDARGMVVGQDHGGGVDGQRLLDDLARVDARAIDGAAEQLVETQHAMPVVEKQAAEDLVPEVAHVRLEERLCVGGAADGLAAGQRLCKVAPRQLRQGAQRREPGPANAAAGAELAGVGVEDLPQAPAVAQQAIGRAAVEERRQQPRVAPVRERVVVHVAMLCRAGMSIQANNLSGIAAFGADAISWRA